jgi:hypothetical protein
VTFRHPHRIVCFVALAVAAVGLTPFLGNAVGVLAPSPPPAGLLSAALGSAAPEMTPARLAVAEPLEVRVAQASATVWLDLLIRIVSLIIAWLSQPKTPTQEGEGAASPLRARP